VGERVTADLRSAVYARMLVQSPQFFETLQTGEVLSRLTGDTTLIQTVVGSSIPMGLRSLFQFIGGMVMLAVTSFYLFSLNLGLMALLMLPIFAIGRKVKKLSRESQDKIADASALAGEILNAVPTVQAYTQEQRETKRFADRAEASFITAIRRTRVRSALTALVITAVMGTIIFVLWVGANQVHEGSMTGGQLASFVLYGGAGGGRCGHDGGSVGRRDACGGGDRAPAGTAAGGIRHRRSCRAASPAAAPAGGDPLRTGQLPLPGAHGDGRAGRHHAGHPPR